MYKLFFTLYFLLFTFYLYSQEQFNYSYGSVESSNIRNIIIQENNYYSSGGCYNSNVMSIVFNKYDLLGNLIESKYLTGDTLEWADGVENSLKETSTGNYIVGGNRGLNYYRDNLLIKFDHNFDTIYTKTYYPVNDGGNSDVLIYNSNIDTDGNYLLVGQSNIDNNYNILPEYQMQLIKTDTLGNLLWRKIYGNSTYKYYGYKVVPAFGGGYLLGGYSNKNGGDNCIIKVDENGENPIFRYFGHPTYADGRIMGITKTKDSCYIISGNYAIDNSGVDKARIYKLDNNLNLIWDKLYLNSETVAGFFNALEKENGNIIVHGSEKNTQNRQMMVIMELTADGDSIWKKTTTALDTTESQNYMESGKLTPDGGMIFAGWNTNINQTPFQQMWLVKTDSMGCDGTQFTCNTTYLEQTTENKNTGLQIWPNPTKGSLTLTLSKGEGIAKEQNTKNIAKSLNTTNNASIPLLGELKGAFNALPINQKLEYNIAHPEQKLWGEAEKQEMLEIQRKYAYILPFEVINGKQNIFSIDPMLAMQVETHNSSRHYDERSEEVISTKQEQIATSQTPRSYDLTITIYDIYGRSVKQFNKLLSFGEAGVRLNVSNLKKGIYFIKVGDNVAKFVKL